MPKRNKERELKAKDIMTKDPVSCTPDTNLKDAAQLMVEHDCGEIPVVDSMETMQPIGVITDRDITCRTVARGKNPLKMAVSECVSSPIVTVTDETSLRECCRTMESSLIRRIPGRRRKREMLWNHFSSRHCQKRRQRRYRRGDKTTVSAYTVSLAGNVTLTRCALSIVAD
jgi:CBS domain-containing protein